MIFRKFVVCLVVALFGFTAGMPARADMNIAQSPLFLITPVTPALVMGLDNSGSMDWETLFDSTAGRLYWHNPTDSFFGRGTNAAGTEDQAEPGVINVNPRGRLNATWKGYVYLFPNGTGVGRRTEADGVSGNNSGFAVPPTPEFGFARSAVYNPIYFNPFTDYSPFPAKGTDNYTDADPTAAFWDQPLLNVTVDLTEEIRRDDNNWVFQFYNGMTIPAGTTVKRADSDACPPINSGTYNDWVTLSTDIAITTDECSVAIAYLPATFWWPEGEPLPAGFGFIDANRLTGGVTPDGQPMFGYELKPSNFSSGAAYNSAINNFANWFQYYRKRVHLSRAALGLAFEDADFLRLGFFRINNRNAVTMRDLSEAGEVSVFYDWLYNLRGSGGTPNRESIDHIGRQFVNQTGSNAPVLEACQRNFGMLVTDGFSSGGSNTSLAGNEDGSLPSPLGDSVAGTHADIAYKYYRDNLRPDLTPGQVPTPAACGGANPPLELNCQSNPHMELFGVTLGAKGRIFGVDEDAMADPWNELTSADWPTSIPAQNPNSIDDIWHATLNTRGDMFSANRPEELIDSLRSVLNSIASRIQPVGISATSTRLDQDSLYYQAELDSSTWSGDLIARRASDDGLEWGAEDKLDDLGYSNRNIKTLNADGDALEDFEYGTDGSGMTSLANIFTTPSPFPQKDVIDYIRGQRSNEQQNGGGMRNRDGVIADIANSRPTFSGPRNEGWGRLDPDYLGYIGEGGLKQTRPPLVLVGSNGGMLHGFNSRTGTELFAYVPGAVQPNLPELADPDYAHRFYVDGQITVADARISEANNDAGWNTVAVGGFGGGARGVYALNITTPENPELLWELGADDHPELGHVFGEPIVTRLGGDTSPGSGQWVAIFGNGYNSDSDNAYLFVVDLKTGAPVGNSPIQLGGDSDVNGLAGPAVFLEPVQRLSAARVYAGDLLGNMWRVDFSAGGAATPAFGGDPLINVGRPITAAPSLAANPSGGLMVYFGTGKLIEPSDRLAGASDYEQFYAVRDQEDEVEESDLGVATISVNNGNRVISAASGASNGFRIELGLNSPSGERVLSRPEVIFGRLVFTSYEPVEDPCTPGGIPRIYLLNALSGGGLIDSLCPNCGVIELQPGAPIDPAVVLRPPAPPDYDPGDDPDPFDPGGGTLPGLDAVGSRDGWCSELLILTPEGFISGGPLCDGRQVWRERRPGT